MKYYISNKFLCNADIAGLWASLWIAYFNFPHFELRKLRFKVIK